MILLINFFNNASVVSLIFKIAALTYGPLLGLYAFGLFMKTKTVNEYLVPVVCIVAPTLTFLLSFYSKELFGKYEFAEELIIVNGLLTFIKKKFSARELFGVPYVQLSDSLLLYTVPGLPKITYIIPRSLRHPSVCDVKYLFASLTLP